MTTVKTQKINSIHVLRGVAIIMIVFSHCLGVFKSNNLIPTSYLFSFLNLFAFNFTAFFVLIAGFLFQHLTYKFDTKTYYKSKFKTVVCPYVSVSIFCFLFLHYNYLSELPWYSDTAPNIITTIIHMMLTGTQLLPLWFMPMIIIIYALSPLFYFWSKKNLIIAGIICMFWVVIFTKPDYTRPLFNLLHYGPVYLVGMMIKQNYDLIMKAIKENLILFILFFGLCFLGPFAYRYYSKLWIEPLYLDTLQKIVLFMLALYFLEGLNHKDNDNWIYKFFSYMANISFPIYFIHEIIVFMLEGDMKAFGFEYIIKTDNGNIAALGAVSFLALTLAISVLIANIIKFIFKDNTKYIIGSIR